MFLLALQGLAQTKNCGYCHHLSNLISEFQLQFTIPRSSSRLFVMMMSKANLDRFLSPPSYAGFYGSGETDCHSPVVTYPPIPNAPISINYTAEVNGQPVYVQHISGYAGGDVSWVSLDFEGSVTISIHALRNVRDVKVCPASLGIPVKLSGNTATVTITEPCRLFLKWDDNFELPFHIFANPMEKNVPQPHDPGVRYFGPGEHKVGQISLKNDETLYLAAGALVHGSVQAENAHHVSIKGRGVLCASHLDRKNAETYGVTGAPYEVIGFRNCADIEIEGITILDSHHWTLVFWDCDRVHVGNIKMFNERHFSTDGINPVNCRDVLIEDSFARCKDDCISIKGLDSRYPENASPIRNIVVQNCIFWSDNNNGVVVGSETKAQSISDIVFRNIDFLRVSNTCGDYSGAMSLICLHDTDISNIRFEDIRIEYCTGPYFNFFFCDSIFRIPGSRQPRGGKIKDIVLQNISVTGGPIRNSYIAGLNKDRIIENVQIRNFEIHGKKITNAKEGNLILNKYTQNIEITS